MSTCGSWEWKGKSHVVRTFHKTAPSGEGNAIRFSNDGTLLAVGHPLDTPENGFALVSIYDSRSGALIHQIAEPKGAGGEMTIAFSPDGKSLIRTVNHSNRPGDYVVVDSVDSWAGQWGLQTLPLIPRSLAVSPDGHFAVIGGQVYGPGPRYVLTPQIAILNLDTHQIVRTINNVFPDENQVQTLAWSADGVSIAAGCIVDGSFRGPNAVRLFDSATGNEILNEGAENAFVSGLTFTSDNKYVIEGQVDGAIRIWDRPHRSLLQKIPVNIHARTILSVSRDSRYLAVGNGSNISIWELH